MIELPSFTYSVIKNALASEAGSELRNNAFFNESQFLDEVKKLAFKRFRASDFPLIRPDDINTISSKIIHDNYSLYLNEDRPNRLYINEFGNITQFSSSMYSI